MLTYEIEPVKLASSCRRWIKAICHATTSMHWNNKIKTCWTVCYSTRGFGVSTRTVKSCLTQSRWMGETCVATEVTRWTRTTAKGVCQMKTNTTEIVLNKENFLKKMFQCVYFKYFCWPTCQSTFLWGRTAGDWCPQGNSFPVDMLLPLLCWNYHLGLENLHLEK